MSECAFLAKELYYENILFSVRQYLNVSSNVLSNIENDAFQQLHSLQTLDLSANNLKALSLKLSDGIEHLSIASNQLRFWPIADVPKNLRVLELQDNNLVEIFHIPSTVRSRIEFPSLISLNVSHNEIKSLPSGLFYPVLQELDASHNLFANLPQYLGAQAPEIAVVKFRGNPMTKIEFSTKISVQLLDLSDLPLLKDLDASQFNSLGT